MANPTTYFGWVMPNSADLVTDLPADFNVFGQGVDTSMQDLLGGTTGQVLSKTSGTNMDFTWVTPTDQTPLTTKGDLFTFTTVDARIGVGANNTVLTADSAEATGLKWATPAGGGLVFINRSTFSNVASHTIDSVFSSTYKSYLVSIEYLYAATTADDLLLRFRYGSSTETGVSYYGNAINATYNSGSVANAPSNGLSSIILTTSSGTSTNPCVGLFEINRVGNASEVPGITGNIMDQSAVTIFNVGSTTITARTYTGLNFFSAASNITGAISVYGLATS